MEWLFILTFTLRSEICTSSPGPYSYFLKFYQVSRSISVSISIYLYHFGQKLMALNTCSLNYSTDTSKLPWRDLVLLWESDLFCSPWFEVLPFTLFHFSSLVSNCSQWWNLNHFSWKVYVFHVCSSLFISPAPTLVLMVNNLYLLQESSYLFSWLCPPSSNWLVSLRHSRKCCIKYTVAPFSYIWPLLGTCQGLLWSWFC